jgi:hypothetical protein
MGLGLWKLEISNNELGLGYWNVSKTHLWGGVGVWIHLKVDKQSHVINKKKKP